MDVTKTDSPRPFVLSLLLKTLLLSLLILMYTQSSWMVSRVSVMQQSSKVDVSSMRRALHKANERRRSKLTSFCSSLSPASPLLIREREMEITIREKVYFVKEHNFAYCPIAKTATSTITSYIQRLVDERHISRHSLHAQLDSQLEKRIDLEKLREQFVFFAFVRHPWSRLMSGYVNAFVKVRGWVRASEDLIELRDEVMAQQGGDNETGIRFSESQKGVAPSPLQFLHYLIATVNKEGWDAINVHFWPHWYKCPFCTVDFDLIGQVETFQEDVTMLGEVLNLSKVFRPEVTKNARSDVANRTAKFFKWLTPHVYEAIEELYSDDFEMFGYERNKYLHLVPNQ